MYQQKHIMQLFRADAAIFLNKLKKNAHENMKKTLSNLLIPGPHFFSVLPTGPKTAQL